MTLMDLIWLCIALAACYAMIKVGSSSSGDDPIGCDVHREMGCSHVDGPLCDYPGCSMLKAYKEAKEEK